jgi:L-alanine-DL-glutamate epimerase-like enolase superfamily enzyme
MMPVSPKQHAKGGALTRAANLAIAPDADARIRRLDLYRVALPLATPLAHSRVATDVLDEVFLALTLAGGGRGVAEVRGNGAYATGYTADAVMAAIKQIAASLIGRNAHDAALAALGRTGNRLATALVEAATLDALARQKGVPLWRHLGAARPPRMVTHASIGFLPPDQAADRARTAAAAGFRRFKIRVGADPASDVARVTAVRSAVPDADLVLDANGAWAPAEAIAMARQLAPLRIAWLEQPTRAGDDLALHAVRRVASMRVVADESVRTGEDVERLLAANAVDGVHVKLEKCGTVAELRRAAAIAKRGGLFVEIGLMDQGRLGSATIACIASTVTADAYELWGFERVQRDIAQGLEVEAGTIQLLESPGNGLAVALPEAARVGTWT